MQNPKVRHIYNSYFHFNNLRTLSTDLASQLSVIETSSYTSYIDRTRRYDNQILIHNVDNINDIDAVLRQYSDGHSPEISIEPLAKTKEVSSWLTKRGFSSVFEHEFLQLHSSDYVATEKRPNNITVERWGQESVDTFLELLKTSGLVCSNDLWSLKRSLYCTDVFRCYVASVDGTPCAWATSYLEGKYAVLANAYTQEAYRSRGCQTALLRARIEDAMGLGVRELLTDVMPNSTSSHNCKSVGFVSVGVRTVWGRG